MSVEKAGSFKQIALRGASNVCPEVDDDIEESEATAEADDFKHDFFSKGNVSNWAPQRGDPGCISVLEFSTDLDDGVKTLLH